ncbi:hypothetical protein BFF78_36085 [Streptomyces fodineus]|uniref:Uncharacterized protein n=1 Tax=Streptomyces fodineus TaxID=1904616 RepID=A0A1D7YJQ3_9ACTN|nr:hypothetical protein BFF78_36085 [Streptomyces fodineus]
MGRSRLEFGARQVWPGGEFEVPQLHGEVLSVFDQAQLLRWYRHVRFLDRVAAELYDLLQPLGELDVIVQAAALRR